MDRLAATTEAIDPVQSRAWYLESLRLHDLLGDAGAVRRALLSLARLAAASGSYESAATLVAATQRVRDGDVVLWFNFRADRARQLSIAFLDENFDGYDRGVRPKVGFYTLTA